MTPPASPPEHTGLAVTWLGHASVLVELDGQRLLFDPVLRPRVGPLTRIAPLIGPEAIPPLSAVLLSHLHADHADLPSLRRLQRRGALIVPEGAGGWMRAKGLRHLRELRAGQTAVVEGLAITATPAVHGRARRPLGPACDPVGYLVSGSRSVYFAGDTDLFEDMAELRGRVDVALLPVWGWGRSVGPGHLDPERAAAAAALISPSVAIPIHWGTLTMGPRRLAASDQERPARRFLELMAQHAPSVRALRLAVGERVAPLGEERQ
ncbi:MAG: MBL fold metallo-hydrolase [Solirubrobacteraceae bacterium]